MPSTQCVSERYQGPYPRLSNDLTAVQPYIYIMAESIQLRLSSVFWSYPEQLYVSPRLSSVPSMHSSICFLEMLDAYA